MLSRLRYWPWLTFAALSSLGALSCVGGRGGMLDSETEGNAGSGGSSDGDDGSAGESGASGAGGPGSGGLSTGGSGASSAGGTSSGGSETAVGIWTDSSEAIEIQYWEFFGGSIRYEKAREQLGAEELALVAEIHLIEPNNMCVSDGSGAEVWVTTDGLRVNYTARILDAVCGNSGPYVGYGAVWALLEAAGCDDRFIAGSTLESARGIGVDSGCYYPLRDAEEPTEAWLLVDVAESGSYDFSFDTCESLGTTQATVLDQLGVTELARSMAPPGDCPNFRAEIPAAGTYALRIETDSPTLGGATFYVRVDSSR